MRQLRFVAIAFLTTLLVINAAFLRKAIALLLCGVFGFHSVGWYGFLSDGGQADAATAPYHAVATSDHAGSVQEGRQKVAGCFLGVCVNTPQVTIPTITLPTVNQPNPAASPQPLSNGDQEQPTDIGNEKPSTDLTGTWIVTGSKFTGDQKGCTAGAASQVFDDGQDVGRGAEIPLTQSGNQFSTHPIKVTYSGADSGSYTAGAKGTISGNKVRVMSSGGGFTNNSVGTVSADGNTVTGETLCKFSGGSATAKGTFTWTRKPSCPRFKTMLAEAKDIRKLADKLATDDAAYHNAVVDIILRGYSAPYAVYMLDVALEGIPEFFKDETQIRAVRSQLVEHMRTKADNRERFATIGINGNYIPAAPVYTKENIDLFCSLDSSKFTKEFWDSLWMAGYIDYPLYTQVEKELIVYGYKDYFETLDSLASIATLPFYEGLYALKTGAKLFLTKLEVGAIKQVEAKVLPKVITTAEEDIEQGIQLSSERRRHILDGDIDANGDIISGGHGAGRNVPGKSQFPSSWNDEKTIQNIRDVVKDPNSKWTQQTGKLGAKYTSSGKPVRYQVDGTRDSVNIRVIIQPEGEGIITAFPTNISPNL